MTFGETLEWQRCNTESINRLGRLGDKLALQLVRAYQDLYADRLNPRKQTEWMKICDDYARRELTDVTRVILQDRYGHKPPRDFKRMDS
jgi:hypothetical protein